MEVDIKEKEKTQQNTNLSLQRLCRNIVAD